MEHDQNRSAGDRHLMKALEALRAYAGDLERQLEKVRMVERGLAELAAASAHWRGVPATLAGAQSVLRAKAEQPRLSDWVQARLRERPEWALEELKREALVQNVDFGGSNPGQALHAALVALKRRGEAEIVGPGVWKSAARRSRGNDQKGPGST